MLRRWLDLLLPGLLLLLVVTLQIADPRLFSVHENGSAEIAVIEGAIRVQPQGNLAAQDVPAGSTVLIAEGSGAATVRAGTDIPPGLTVPRGDRLNHHDRDRTPRSRQPRPR